MAAKQTPRAGAENDRTARPAQERVSAGSYACVTQAP